MTATGASLAIINRTQGTCLAERVRVADRHWSRLCGLLATPQTALLRGAGLWLVPCRGVHMLGMRYAIDAFYFDKDLRVVHIEPHLQPWRTGALRRDAWAVLEVAAGTAERTRTALGDSIVWQPRGPAAPCD